MGRPAGSPRDIFLPAVVVEVEGVLRLVPRGESMQGGKGSTAQRRVYKRSDAQGLAEVGMNGALLVNNLERVNEGAEEKWEKWCGSERR